MSDLSPVPNASGVATRKHRLWPAALALGALLAVLGVGWFASSKARVADGAASFERPAPPAPAREIPVVAPPVATPAPASPAEAPAPEAPAKAQSPESASEGEGAQADSSALDAAREAAGVRAGELVERARVLHKRRKFAPAKARYREALKVYPDYPPALAGLAQLAIRQHDAKQAVLLANQLVSAQPDDASHLVLLGDAYKSAGKRKEAREAWKIAARKGSAEARARLKR